MATLLPHPPYAEDQPYARSFLTFHVLRAGAATGSIISLLTATASTLYRQERTLSAFVPRLILHSSRGIAAGVLLSGLALAGRMRGRENIEWKDRAWRLIENKGQSQLDFWIIDGGVLGAVAAIMAARRGMLPGMTKMAGRMGTVALGGAGVGVTVGTADYMVWRYGIKGGKFE